MNENAEKWVKALTSGEYKQTKELLSDGVGFCCLGVACELAVKEGVIPEPRRTDEHEFGDTSVAYGSDGNRVYDTDLPPEVQEWLGLKDGSGIYDRVENGGHAFPTVKSLAGDNDEGKTFEEIAKIIRKREKDLFE